MLSSGRSAATSPAAGASRRTPSFVISLAAAQAAHSVSCALRAAAVAKRAPSKRLPQRSDPLDQEHSPQRDLAPLAHLVKGVAHRRGGG